jgi:hypothetical protein
MNTAHPNSRGGSNPKRRDPARATGKSPMSTAALRRPQESEVRVRLRGVGSMAVGAVEAIGAHTVGFARGDRVVFPLTQDERAMLDETDAPAGMGALTVSAERLLGVPRDVRDEQAARLLAPGLAARVLLRQLRPVGSGDRVRIDLEAGIVRAVVDAWAVALGATLEGPGMGADVVLDEDLLRQAHAFAFRRGHLQAGSAEVFARIRDGVFDRVLATADRSARRAAA